jgi:hypothetical protein
VHVVIALVLIFFSGVATVMFGALLTRVPNPFALMTDFSHSVCLHHCLEYCSQGSSRSWLQRVCWAARHLRGKL